MHIMIWQFPDTIRLAYEGSMASGDMNVAFLLECGHFCGFGDKHACCKCLRRKVTRCRQCDPGNPPC